jgi:hypothetical protein
MFKKYFSREFILVVVCGLLAVAVMKGWLTPDRINETAGNIQKTTETIPVLIDSLSKLIEGLGPLAGLFGLAWAYLKRRSDQKMGELKEGSSEAELEKLKLELEKAKYEFAQAKLKASSQQ